MGFRENFVRQSGGPTKYYTEMTTTNLYVQKSFGSQSTMLDVSNDSETDTIQVSFDGATLDGDLKAGETKTFYVSGKTSVYIKGTVGGDNVRLWAY